MNQHAKLFIKHVTNLQKYMMASENPSTPLLLQVILSLSTDSMKNSYQHLDGNMGELTDLKNRVLTAAIMCKWFEKIWVMGRDACVFVKMHFFCDTRQIDTIEVIILHKST